jgi:hypothetical protein
MHPTARCLGLVAIGIALIAVWPARVGAITVDGQRDPSYTLMSTQTTQTNGRDNAQGLATFSEGSELDVAYATVDNGVLYLFFAGNVTDTFCGGQACTSFAFLDVFIDSQTGGQNPLVSPQPAAFGSPYPGLTFDTAFTPDYWVEFAPLGALDHSFRYDAWYEALPAGGGGVSLHLGEGFTAGGPGTLSGGTNPFGLIAAIDNRNTAGVGAGCGAASGAGVSTGVELAIPVAAIGNPTGCIKVGAFLKGVQDLGQDVLNQVLPPVPPGSCALGPPSTLDFAGIAGDQFFTICLGATPTHGTTWGGLKAIYR